ncbi:MAG TPA: periplasmic heavy metal sensor [Thermopetrobacter sp.]|nr:periplasmic heavy metal sensor [Thermopetrobacter sp.]
MREPGKRRWPWVLLIVSLALNLLIVGGVAGMLARHYGIMRFAGLSDGPPHHPPPQLRMGRPGLLLRAANRLMRRLPPPRRRQLFQIIRPHRQAIREATRAVAAARLRLARALQARPHEERRISAALRELKQAELRARAAVMAFNEAFVLALNEQERVRLARLLERSGRRRFPARRSDFRRN